MRAGSFFLERMLMNWEMLERFSGSKSSANGRETISFSALMHRYLDVQSIDKNVVSHTTRKSPSCVKYDDSTIALC